MPSQNSAAIMVIDSDPLALTSITAALQATGYVCFTSQNTDAAIQSAQNLELDLIICEETVAGRCGFELCRQLRENPRNRDVPTIFVSEHPMDDVVRRKQDAGAIFYLRKPFDPEVLFELVDKALWMPHLVQTRIQHASSKINRSHLSAHARRHKNRSGLLDQ